MDTPLLFGEWLKRRRKALDLTQGHLAQQIHCSLTTIKRIEASDLVPSRQLAELIARALKIPPAEHSAFVTFARAPNATARADGFRESSPLSPASAKHFHLPAPLTGLIGCEREVDAACELLLNPRVRLVTFTGPPGTGKTRLSLATAERLESQFRDGACFVPLASVCDTALVVPAIARALELRESSSKELSALVSEFLRDKQLLLVLDNFEQIVSAAPRVTELLGAAREVKAIVTSRTILQVYGEYEFPVPPLHIPDIRHLPPLTALEHYSAIELFVERAHAVKPRFELSDANARTVAEICAWLDGLPLAIEMAAAQVRRHAPPVLLAQLRTRLETLTGGPRDLTPRQQTLRGAIAWSYDLLAGDERELFNHLGVFVESFNAESAAAVWGKRAVERVRELLRDLVDKSLLRVETADRFAMLETIREYAQEQLRGAGMWDAARQQHADHFLNRLETLSPQVRHGNIRQIETLAEIDADYANIHAAMLWAIESADDPALGLRFATGLYDYWEIRGYYGQSQQLMLAALARATEPSSLRAQVLANASLTTRWLGDHARALELLQESIALSERLGDDVHLALGFQHLGITYGMQRDYAAAVVQFERALAIYRRLNRRGALASTLGNLSLALFRANDHARAKEVLTEALAVNRERGDLNSLAHNLQGLARIAYTHCEWEQAENFLRAALATFKQIGHQRSLGHTLTELGRVVIERGRHSEGVRLMAVAKTIHAAIGLQLDAGAEQERDATLEIARRALGRGQVEQLLAEGATLELDGVL